MQTKIDLPDSAYRKGERVARAQGVTLEELIVRILERELTPEQAEPSNSKRVHLPLLRSRHPGTLDLRNFDFDDLLA